MSWEHGCHEIVCLEALRAYRAHQLVGHERTNVVGLRKKDRFGRKQNIDINFKIELRI